LPDRRLSEEASTRGLPVTPTPFSVSSLAFAITLLAGSLSLSAQPKVYQWDDIDCRHSPLVAWSGLKCRSTNVVVNESNIGAFRRWSAFGTGPCGYYAHMFLWKAQNTFSYLSAGETTADFVKWMFEDDKSVGQVSPVARYKDADYVTFTDQKQSRLCVGFRRLGPARRDGYASITGGILCTPPGRTVTTDDIALFIDNVRLRAVGD
jgi:hypothetical protein